MGNLPNEPLGFPYVDAAQFSAIIDIISNMMAAPTIAVIWLGLSLTGMEQRGFEPMGRFT
jgi:hypothetical protein